MDVRRRRTKMEVASQVVLFVGAFSVFLIGNGNPWGFVVGMAQQPFWYYTAINNRQWGLLGASVVYTAAWINGIYQNFF